MKGPPYPTLPDEIMERLSIHGALRVTVGDEGDVASCNATAAPLKDMLYVLLPRNPQVEQVLETSLRAELRAEDPDGTWSLVTRGRLHLGRTAQSDERRSELYHWVPDGRSPAGLHAAVYYPEHVEYLKGSGSDRIRAVGPVPGSAPPAWLSAWMRAADFEVGPWLFGVFLLDWLWLAFQEDRLRNGLFLAVMFAIGASLLWGVTLIGLRLRHDAWRKGGSSRAAADALARVGLPPGNLYRVGTALIAFGLVFTLLLMFAADPTSAGVAVLVSGAPLLAPLRFARYAIDREKT